MTTTDPEHTARIRELLRRTAPSKLVGRGRACGYQLLHQGKLTGRKLRGLTKALDSRVHSGGSLPSIAKRAAGPRPGGAWRGKGGGRLRGARIDAQLSRLINNGTPKRRSPTLYALTKVALGALHHAQLTPVLAQRTVCNHSRGIGSAADVIALTSVGNELVVIELKCGFDGGGRLAPVTKRFPGQQKPTVLKMRSPLDNANDCVMHRHLAQLSATVAMFRSERETMEALRSQGVESVRGLLLYCSDEEVEYVDMDEWWVEKGVHIVHAL